MTTTGFNCSRRRRVVINNVLSKPSTPRVVAVYARRRVIKRAAVDTVH